MQARSAFVDAHGGKGVALEWAWPNMHPNMYINYRNSAAAHIVHYST